MDTFGELLFCLPQKVYYLFWSVSHNKEEIETMLPKPFVKIIEKWVFYNYFYCVRITLLAQPDKKIEEADYDNPISLKHRSLGWYLYPELSDSVS